MTEEAALLAAVAAVRNWESAWSGSEKADEDEVEEDGKWMEERDVTEEGEGREGAERESRCEVKTWADKVGMAGTEEMAGSEESVAGEESAAESRHRHPRRPRYLSPRRSSSGGSFLANWEIFRLFYSIAAGSRQRAG